MAELNKSAGKRRRGPPGHGALTKSATCIAGFDEMTSGGQPSGRISLLVGDPGSGKTIFALQFLVNGGARCLVVDPVSALSRAGNELTAHGVADEKPKRREGA